MNYWSHSVKDIKDITYDKGPPPKYKKIMDKSPSLVTIDWHNIISSPPPNDSDITRNELEYIKQISSNLPPEERDLVMSVDDDPNNLFKRYLLKEGLSFPEKEFNKAYYGDLEIIITNLKWKFKRPRPYQLGPLLGINIGFINTKTHHTPAYPSGHTALGHLSAAMLSDLYPEHSAQFYKIASMVGHARVIQGVHYPSDNDAAAVLSKALWNDIKYRIFPTMRTKSLLNEADLEYNIKEINNAPSHARKK